MIRIAVVEDDDKSANKLLRFIKQFEEDAECSCPATRFKNGMDFISEYKPLYDLVFMDIDMPLMDGMKTAKKLRMFDRNVCIIFVTNLGEFAIKGYEVNALDFIVKPIDYFSFYNKVCKAKDYIENHQDVTIMLTVGTDKRIVSVRDIKYVEVLSHFLIYHIGNDEISIRGQLFNAEKELAPYNFFRCGKSYLINMQHITKVSGTAVYVDGKEIPLSRSKKKEFMTAFMEYWSGGKN